MSLPKAFFDRARNFPFPGKLTGPQVEGLTAIVEAGRDGYGLSDAQLAYVLATAYHETAGTMQPIEEYGDNARFHRKYDIEGERPNVAKVLGNTKPGDGVRFKGRGYVQITGRRNYEQYGIADDPDRALDPDTALMILFDGMAKGVFTGKSLTDYIVGNKADFRNARRIVNGVDKADVIAGYAKEFLAALKLAPQDAPTLATEPKRRPSVEVVTQDPDGRDAAAAGVLTIGGLSLETILGHVEQFRDVPTEELGTTAVVAGVLLLARLLRRRFIRREA